MATNDQLKTLENLLKENRFAMLTSVDERGRLVSRPMTVQDRSEDWTLFFVTQRDTDVAQQSDGKQVNLAIVGKGTFVSISGTGHVVNDEAKKKELWNVFNEAYTEGGAENPDNVILAVDAESAEYWDSPNAVANLVGVLKAAATGTRPDGGENETVQL